MRGSVRRRPMKMGLKGEKRVLVTPEEREYPMPRGGGSVGGNRIWKSIMSS